MTMRSLFYFLFLTLFINATVLASQPQGLDEETGKLFFKLQDFSLLDQNGRLHQLSRKINSRFIVTMAMMPEVKKWP